MTEPTLIQTITCCLSVVARVTDIQHHRSILPEKLFKHTCDDIINFGIFGRRRIVLVGNKKVVCFITQEIGIFVEADTINHSVFRGKTKGQFVQFDNPIGRGLIDVVSRKPHRKPNSFSRWSTEAIHSCLRFMVAISAALNSASEYCLKSFSSIALNFFCSRKNTAFL